MKRASSTALTSVLPKKPKAGEKQAPEHLLLAAAKEAYEGVKNEAAAKGQKKYMRDQFEFYGMTSPTRRGLHKGIEGCLSERTLSQTEVCAIVKLLWDQPQRDFQYFAQEFAKDRLDVTDAATVLDLVEEMVTKKSWWDTVDFISPHLAGRTLAGMPQAARLAKLNSWIDRSSYFFLFLFFLFFLWS